MRTSMKKILSVTLTLALALSLCLAPMSALAAEIQSGTGTIIVNSTVIGFAGQEWYVVAGYSNTTFGTDADSVTLLLKTGQTAPRPYSDARFNSKTSICDYEDSTLHDAMNSIYSGISSGEKGLILPRTLDKVWDGTGTRNDNGTLDTQYVWPLSTAEALAINSTILRYSSDRWWLRSPSDNYNSQAAYVTAEGVVSSYGANVNNPYLRGVRPAFNLNLATVLFTSPASGNKASTVGATLSVATPPTGAVKLTVKDTTLNLAAPTITGITGRQINFDYNTTGTTGAFNSLSAVVKNGSTLKYYGSLLATPAATGAASVIIPDAFDSAAGDTLEVFIEQINGANITDFASTPPAFPAFTVAATPIVGSVACTTAANDDGKITGTTTDMEYSADGGTTWSPCATGNTIVPAGNYLVRTAASGATTIASASVPVIVAAYAAPTFTLTVTNGTGSGSYTSGSSVPIVANPAPAGQVFSHWTTNGGGSFDNASSAATNFTMPAAVVTVTANYVTAAPPPYSGGGTIFLPPTPPPAPKTAFPCDGEVTGRRIDVFKFETLKTRLFRLSKGEEFTILGLANKGRAFEIEQDGRKGYIAFKDIAATFGAPIRATALRKANAYTLLESGKLKRVGYFKLGQELWVHGITGKYLINKQKNNTYYLDASQWVLAEARPVGE